MGSGLRFARGAFAFVDEIERGEEQQRLVRLLVGSAFLERSDADVEIVEAFDGLRQSHTGALAVIPRRGKGEMENPRPTSLLSFQDTNQIPAREAIGMPFSMIGQTAVRGTAEEAARTPVSVADRPIFKKITRWGVGRQDSP